MDESYCENEISMSPSQILERLQSLRQLQLLQRGKLQKQRLEYQETSNNSSCITEIVSHFSNSVSYNTFRSLLQSPQTNSNDISPQLDSSDISQKVNKKDLLEGVSMLNLSQESEFIVTSPTSAKSKKSASSRTDVGSAPSENPAIKTMAKKHISLDEMPILSPKKDFETLVLEKLQREQTMQNPKSSKKDKLSVQCKKPFLRRGEGMARFGLNKKDLIIQNTKSLPWRQKNLEKTQDSCNLKSKKDVKYKKKDVTIQILEKKLEPIQTNIMPKSPIGETTAKHVYSNKFTVNSKESKNDNQIESTIQQGNVSQNKLTSNVTTKIQTSFQSSKDKHPLIQNNGKTWAAVLTKEQNDLLRKLKQSDYYKNFTSPAKSTISDVSCDEKLSTICHERELAEQNMFDLLESKVSHDSFNLENSFFNKFLRKSKLECSGESTPLIMQKCLANNPELFHILPDLNHAKTNENSHSDVETCYSECCSDICSTVSSCCSCKTVESANSTNKSSVGRKDESVKVSNKEVGSTKQATQMENLTGTDIIKENMVEMNAKLIATSELLKDRLRELEDEIETFRKENANLTKMREEIDLERQKFYEEKTAFEQKFNEEKILSEYYLAEEKEKITKQKQIYDRYIREMRGRLNKKDRDEVLNLKKEINDLKEEIRIKDAKSTSTIARLRNQLKIMEKEKKDLQTEVEKLKKENRRIQHSNEITRRLTNMKYLEEINKKLTHMSAKETQSEANIDNNSKYKSFEIERQSRSRRAVPQTKTNMRPRAKSVPNLNVTSRYAKYFSQRDAVSQQEKNKTLHMEHLARYKSDSEDTECEEEPINLDTSGSLHDRDNMSDSECENNLEKLYAERFQSTSPKSSRSNSKVSNDVFNHPEHTKNLDSFFIHKPNSSRGSNSSTSKSTSHANLNKINRSKSPVSILRSNSRNSHIEINKDLYSPSEQMSNTSSESINRSNSPKSVHGNHSSTSLKPPTVVNNEKYGDRQLAVSPEPSTSKTSIAKTNLNPTEIHKPDGSKELRFPNGNVKYISSDGRYSKFVYYNGDVKENFYKEGRIKYFYAESKTFHTTHPDGLEVLEFPDGQVEKRYKDGSSEIRLPNGSVRYFDPKNEHVREEWRFPDGTALTIASNGDQRMVFANGQVEVHAKDHKRREFPDGTVKLVYNDGTSETRYASGRVRIKDKHGNLIMDSAPGCNT